MIRRRLTAWHALALLPVVFLALFFVYPLGAILLIGIAPGGQPDLSGFLRVFTSRYYLDTFAFTVAQAALSTALTLAAALPAAHIFARYTFRGKRLLLTLSTLPFVLPAVLVAAAFTALVGDRGLVNSLLSALFGEGAPQIAPQNTLTLVLIAHVFYNYPLALRIVAAYWANQNPHMEDAARVLGARGWRLWWHVRLPMLRPALLAAGLLVFTFCFTSFGVLLILGGPRFASVEVEIYRQAVGVFNLPAAAALSIAQLVAMLALMIAYTRISRRLSGGGLQSARSNSRPPVSWRERVWIGANLTFMAALLFLPLLALIVRSFSGPDGPTLRNYALLGTNPRGSVLFAPPLEAIGNSLLFAAIAAAIALFLGLIAARLIAGSRARLARWLDPALMLPLATSAVTLGLGYTVAFSREPLNLRSSLVIIPLIHTLVALPFVVRTALPAYQAIPHSIAEAASILGASGWRRFWSVELPLMRRAIIVGITFAFTVSMGEFGATLFLARPESTTMPLVIYRLLGQPGASNYGQALAMSTLLLAVCAAGFLLIERFRSVDTAEF